MKFEKALRAMRNGKKVKLNDYVYHIEDNTIWSVFCDDNFKLLGHLHYDEILSEDWEIVND